LGFTESEGTSESTSEEHSHSTSHTESETDTESESTTKGVTKGKNQSRGGSESLARVPFYEYAKRRNMTSRTYVSTEEFLVKKEQLMRTLPKAHFVLKVGSSPAVVVRAPLVEDPLLGNRRREEVMAVQLERYGSIEEAIREEEERTKRILGGAAKKRKPDTYAPKLTPG
jgi:hypothetical protein